MTNPLLAKLQATRVGSWPTNGAVLADVFIGAVRGGAAKFAKISDPEATVERAEKICAMIAEAPKYVLSLPVLCMADELASAGFQPQPIGDITWIEWTEPQDETWALRMCGLFLAQEDDGTVYGRVVMHAEAAQYISSYGLEVAADGRVKVNVVHDENRGDTELVRRVIATAAAALELIRHPRAVVKDHHPARVRHVRAKGRLKPQPVGAYTEVLVHVTREDPETAASGQPSAATGIRKRFHHVRPFARVRLGKPELVVGHWRGDPSLGVLKPRAYRVVP